MHMGSDLMLILEPDAGSKETLLAVAEGLGCDHVETDSVETLHEILALRRPTIAVLALDRPDNNNLAIIDALTQTQARPATLLVGSLSARLLTSARRSAEARGLPVVGVALRPLDAPEVERLLTPHLAVAPPIAVEEIEAAIANHELTLLYQPKVAVTADAVRLQGVEALVRWQHPRRGLLQPLTFLRSVEQYGLMPQLTDFVMMEAVRQGAQWRAAGCNLEIVVNLSTKLVQDREFPERLAVLLRENDFPPPMLVLDVTESLGLTHQSLLLDVFTRLRILGVGLSLDNFGTASGALTDLYKLPFSEIKVDRALLADVAGEREARLIVKSLVDLAHKLRLTACAEGVETRQMFEFVRNVGFDTAQGRLFSEPVPAAEIERMFVTWPSAGPAASGSWRAATPLDFEGSMSTHHSLKARPRRDTAS
jgi:EAL domain-containing protein (putative c-di-GMP-specific phosphodiesterase class I)